MKQTQHSATGARRDHVTGSLADGVDQLIVSDTWSDLRNSREAPEIDVDIFVVLDATPRFGQIDVRAEDQESDGSLGKGSDNAAQVVGVP